jgi:hypothetical protein
MRQIDFLFKECCCYIARSQEFQAHFSTQEVRKYFNFLQFEKRSMRFLPYMLVLFQKYSGLAQFWPKSILAKHT